MKKIRFSCLMASYHKDIPSQLIDSFKSIENQTLPVDEIIFVKDGFLTEELDNIVSDFSTRIPITVVQLKENKGLGNALCQGLKQCKYNHVVRMDTDDICEPNRFERLINYMIENDSIDIVGSWAKDIDNQGNITGDRKMPLSHEDIYKLIWTCPFIHPTVAFKKSSILGVGSYSTTIKRRQDYDLWFRAAKGDLKFANIPEFLLQYRFTESFYKKNNFKVVLDQAKMGVKGLMSLKSISVLAYLGVLMPAFRSLFPDFIAQRIHKVLRKFDPRNKAL